MLCLEWAQQSAVVRASALLMSLPEKIIYSFVFQLENLKRHKIVFSLALLPVPTESWERWVMSGSL